MVEFGGIVWGFFDEIQMGSTKWKKQILRIVNYWDEESKNKAMDAFSRAGYYQINTASNDDMNVDYWDLLRDAQRAENLPTTQCQKCEEFENECVCEIEVKPKFDCEDNSDQENWDYCGKKECASCGGY